MSRCFSKEFEERSWKRARKAYSGGGVQCSGALGHYSGSEITRKYPETGLSEDTFTVSCSGSGGQSFWRIHPQGG